MAGRESTSVGRGKTWYGNRQTIPDGSTIVYAADSIMAEGREGTFKHTDPTDPSKVLSNRTVTARLMRNTSGITVYGGMLVVDQAGFEGRRFNGYAGAGAVAAPVAGVIDDHLGTAGCRDNDLCWVIVEGPCLAYTANATGGFTGDTHSVGDFLHAMSAAASTANTTGGTTADDGGKFANWAGLTATSTQTTDGTLTKKILNVFAKAMSAATSGNTNTKKLIDVLRR